MQKMIVRRDGLYSHLAPLDILVKKLSKGEWDTTGETLKFREVESNQEIELVRVPKKVQQQLIGDGKHIDGHHRVLWDTGLIHGRPWAVARDVNGEYTLWAWVGEDFHELKEACKKADTIYEWSDDYTRLCVNQIAPTVLKVDVLEYHGTMKNWLLGGTYDRCWDYSYEEMVEHAKATCRGLYRLNP